jgi:2-phosphosulfolactate phosphatase
MHSAHRQSGHQVRFDWGLDGADAVSTADCLAVLVDVLSFTTTVSVAVDRGVEVHPYRWADETAAAYAEEHDAALAVGRSEATDGSVSLSPNSLRTVDVPPARLVLPSPNGSAIAWRLAQRGSRCIAGCLRNADAIAEWIITHAGDAPVAVIAAGERWPGGGLRPCLEDVWGAGAVIAALQRRGRSGLSPEARSAVAAYDARGRVSETLRTCASGAELVDRGFGGDVDIAAEVERSTSVPRLEAGAFTDAGA